VIGTTLQRTSTEALKARLIELREVYHHHPRQPMRYAALADIRYIIKELIRRGL
jgi:hypothetical protein